MDILFSVSEQTLTKLNKPRIIANSKNYLYASFQFMSSDWKGVITAVFDHENLEKPYLQILENGRCLVPYEVIKEGMMRVSLFCEDKITTNEVNVYIGKSGSLEGIIPSEPTPDVYTQIIKMINSLESAEVSEEVIEHIVVEYLENNPIDSVNKEEVVSIVNDYMTTHSEELKGSKGDQGKSAYEIALDSGFEGTESEWLDSLKGKNGLDGEDGSNGTNGKSAYEIALDNGFEGTEIEWLNSLGANIVETQVYSLIDTHIEETITEVETYSSDNLLDIADVAETSKNGISMIVTDEVITLNGTATANTDLNLSSNFLEDGTYTFAYEILEGSVEGKLQYGYQSGAFVTLSTTGTTQAITSHNRTKIRVPSGTICTNLKIHLWAVAGEEYKKWSSFGEHKEVFLTEDIRIKCVEEHNNNSETHLTPEEKLTISNLTGCKLYNEAINDIEMKVFNVTDNGAIVAVLLSDTHVRPDDEQSVNQYREMVDNIVEITKKIACDGVIHLGDHANTQWWWANRYMEDLVYQKYIHDYANMLRKAEAPLYLVQGNHDGGFIPKNDETGTTGSEYSSHSILYRNLGSITDRSAIRTLCADVIAPYYYVDNDITRTRLIFMTSNMEDSNNDVKGYHYNNLLWLRDTLVSTNKDWNVLVFNHISCTRFYSDLKNADKYIELVNAFNEHRSTDGLDSHLTADFTEYTGKVVAEICGHYHGDSVIYPDDERAKLLCPSIEIDCGSCLVGGGVITSGDFYDENDTNARSYTDITQHLFDVMVYRPDLSKIFMYRFGAGEDREIDV